MPAQPPRRRKLLPSEVETLRRRHRLNLSTVAQLSEQFGVSKATVKKVVYHMSYKTTTTNR
jgi:hypothetical protein